MSTPCVYGWSAADAWRGPAATHVKLRDGRTYHQDRTLVNRSAGPVSRRGRKGWATRETLLGKAWPKRPTNSRKSSVPHMAGVSCSLIFVRSFFAILKVDAGSGFVLGCDGG